jgi:hypothetical protein
MDDVKEHSPYFVHPEWPPRFTQMEMLDVFYPVRDDFAARCKSEGAR